MSENGFKGDYFGDTPGIIVDNLISVSKSARPGAFFVTILLLFTIIPIVVSAKGIHPKGYNRDRGKEIAVTEPFGWPIAVRASSYVAASVESLPEMAVIRLTPYNPWWHFWGGVSATTTASISGFPKDANLHVYTNGYRIHEQFKTDSNGRLDLSFNSKVGAQFIIKSSPSTKHIYLGGFLFPEGGDCSSIGVWDAVSKTCTLNKNVAETISIEDDGITLNGNSHSVIGTGSGDGVYVDVANANVKNLSISNFARGVVYAAPFSLFSIPTGGTIDNLALSNIVRNVMIEGISETRISNADITGGDTGMFIIDKNLDGFPTYDVVVTDSTIKNTNIACG